MSYTAISNPGASTATLLSQLLALIANDADAQARLALIEQTGLLNGSFQQDTDADGVPDGWTADETGGGSIGVDATDFYHANKSVKITLGSSNQYAQLKSGESAAIDDYIPCHYGERIEVELALKASVGSIPAKAIVRWFDEDGNQVGTDETVWSTSSAPTSWEKHHGQAVTDSGAYYYRVILQGGDTSSAAGQVNFDAVRSYVFHGMVQIEPTANLGSGTLALTSGTHYVAGERPVRVWATVGWTCIESGSGNASLVGNGLTLVNESLGSLEGASWDHAVPLNDNGQWTVTATGDVTATCTVWAYEV